MMYKKISHNLTRNLSNILGKKVKNKIVVIESDDWGSIRMPSKDAYNKLLSLGYSVDTNFFTKFDGLESKPDLDRLFDLLIGVKDHKGNNPVITALSIMANPDFNKIKEYDFNEYYYEPFYKTSDRYDGSDLLKSWKEGNRFKVFEPQFHGREHLNVKRWMEGLQRNFKTTKLTFDLELTGLQANIANEDRGDYQAAFDIDKIEDVLALKTILRDGISMFKDVLGYQPLYFCPTNGPFNNVLEIDLKSLGIEFINTAKIQKEPLGDGKIKNNYRLLGQIGPNGLRYLTRNVVFEPSNSSRVDWVDLALNDISIAFKWNKPAIISSHRVNYVSRIEISNRDNGLKKLSLLLNRIIEKWPDVEFMSSSELGKKLVE